MMINHESRRYLEIARKKKIYTYIAIRQLTSTVASI